jgi:hypothetical protein
MDILEVAFVYGSKTADNVDVFYPNALVLRELKNV